MNLDVYKLFLVHCAANALLLWLGYEWLGVGESTGARLALSGLDALAILTLVCWLYGATFAFFRMGTGLNAAFRGALRNLVPLVFAALLVLALYGAVAWGAAASDQPAFQLASWLTLKWRTPVKPATVARVFHVGFWILRWAVIPVVLLPMAPAVAVRGWRGFRELKWLAEWRDWFAAPLLLSTGFMLPFTVLAIVPAVGGFGPELVSFVLRALIAYLLMVCSVLALAFATARR